MTAPNRNPDLARQNHAHALTPLLFRSLAPGDRKKHKLDVTWHRKDGRSVRFWGPEPFGADDLRVLQGLIALADPLGTRLSPEPQTEVGAIHRELMEFKWDSLRDDAIHVVSSYRRLASIIGLKDIDDSRYLRASIERLWAASIICDDGKGAKRGFRLLTSYQSSSASGNLNVCLNPLIARAVMRGQFVYISMAEVRALDGDIARLLHHRLCAFVDMGKTKPLFLDTLAGYVWPPTADAKITRKRRVKIKAALMELRGIGWTVGMVPTNIVPVTIMRPFADGGLRLFGVIAPGKEGDPTSA